MRVRYRSRRARFTIFIMVIILLRYYSFFSVLVVFIILLFLFFFLVFLYVYCTYYTIIFFEFSHARAPQTTADVSKTLVNARPRASSPTSRASRVSRTYLKSQVLIILFHRIIIIIFSVLPRTASSRIVSFTPPVTTPSSFYFFINFNLSVMTTT